MTAGEPIEIFATCPSSADHPAGAYRRRVRDVAMWSEQFGCTGILVYSDNRLMDPWLVAQCILDATERLSPLVAVQPAYMHPYAVATIVSSLASLYGRRVFLNMVAGGFRHDLTALCDETPHDERYTRLIEYTSIVQSLLRGDNVSWNGAFYRVRHLRLQPALPPELVPGVFISGSSPAGRNAARTVGATSICYPRPAGADEGAPVQPAGVRLGIIARPNDAAAWRVARDRFPDDRKGQLTHQLAMQVSDAHWHRQLSELARTAGTGRHPYWLVPFENYKSACPYLVGSYERVGVELRRYVALGYHTFILDIPPTREDLEHTGAAFACAGRAAAV